MSVTKIKLGTHPETGQPLFQFLVEPDVEGQIPEVVATGRASGLVQLADGTTYDVTEPFIEVDSREHALEVHHHIGVQMERSGLLDTVHPETGEPVKFQHTDCTHCDAPSADEHDKAWRGKEGEAARKARAAAKKEASN